MAHEPDGVRRFLGTGIETVHPTDGALYVTAWARRGAVGAVRDTRELWRHVPTGEEPWGYVATIPDELRIDDIVVGPTGAILILSDEGLHRVTPEQHSLSTLLETKDSDYLSVTFPGGGRLAVTARRPSDPGYFQGGQRRGQTMEVCELWEIDLGTGKRERVKEFWNVRQVKAGRAGVFALSPAGKLRRLEGRSFVNAPGQVDYERIVRVGRTCVWLESKQGRLIAVDAVGRHRFDDGPRVPEPGSWDVDPHSDTVIFLDHGTPTGLEPRRGGRTALETDRR
jgi:hypothetical protein